MASKLDEMKAHLRYWREVGPTDDLPEHFQWLIERVEELERGLRDVQRETAEECCNIIFRDTPARCATGLVRHVSQRFGLNREAKG